MSSSSARVDLLRGQVAFASGLGSDAPPLLLKAARRLEPLDLDLARETYLTAWMAALFAGRLAGPDDLLEISRAARALPPPGGRRVPLDLLLDGLALLVTDGPRRRGADAAAGGERLRRRGHPRGGRPAVGLAGPGGRQRPVGRRRLARDLARQVQLARDAGALAQLPIILSALGMASAWSGRLREPPSL